MEANTDELLLKEDLLFVFDSKNLWPAVWWSGKRIGVSQVPQIDLGHVKVGMCIPWHTWPQLDFEDQVGSTFPSPCCTSGQCFDSTSKRPSLLKWGTRERKRSSAGWPCWSRFSLLGTPELSHEWPDKLFLSKKQSKESSAELKLGEELLALAPTSELHGFLWRVECFVVPKCQKSLAALCTAQGNCQVPSISRKPWRLTSHYLGQKSLQTFVVFSLVYMIWYITTTYKYSKSRFLRSSLSRAGWDWLQIQSICDPWETHHFKNTHDGNTQVEFLPKILQQVDVL